jgi:16S rRNA (cytosine1402-N4)-methyltransferase
VLAEIGSQEISGILFDPGLSSMQLDDPARGFAYSQDGPLDMRADPAQRLTAEEIVNEYSAAELADIFFTYGEERRSRQAAACIVEYRTSRRITTTRQLAELLRPALSRQQYFRSLARIWMALRIAVNDELTALGEGLSAGVSALAEGGRVVVLSYHSLEDRIVKKSFKEWSRRCNCSPALGDCTCGANPLVKILTSHPVIPDAEELAENSRARPAKLRAAEKLKAGRVQPIGRHLRGNQG